MTKYAIKVRMSATDWLYITEGNGVDLRIMFFEDYEEAESFADSWRLSGSEGNVTVVEYDETSFF